MSLPMPAHLMSTHTSSASAPTGRAAALAGRASAVRTASRLARHALHLRQDMKTRGTLSDSCLVKGVSCAHLQSYPASSVLAELSRECEMLHIVRCKFTLEGQQRCTPVLQLVLLGAACMVHLAGLDLQETGNGLSAAASALPARQHRDTAGINVANNQVNAAQLRHLDARFGWEVSDDVMALAIT